MIHKVGYLVSQYGSNQDIDANTRGKAVFDESREIKKKIFESMPMLLELYKQGEDDPRGAAFYLENLEAVLMDMQGNFKKFDI